MAYGPDCEKILFSFMTPDTLAYQTVGSSEGVNRGG